MYKHLIVLVLVALFFTACKWNTSEAYYQYGGVTIKRVDRSGETSFFYLGSSPEKSSGKIWARYSGINDGFSGYLRFYKSGKVDVLSSNGHFQSSMVDTNRFSFQEIDEQIKLGDSVCVIMLSTRYEAERNKANKSKIKVLYKNL